jgi:hypothetical protein
MCRIGDTLIVVPALHGNKVCHKTGNVTFEEDVIASNDVSLVDIDVVILCHN